jgi:hypothetical protein
MLYSDRARTWKVDPVEYEFRKDSIPRIIFGKTRLMAFKRGDSIEVHQTKGVYFPTKNLWKGKGGKLTWNKVAIDTNNAYAIVKDYEVKTNKSELKIDQVDFFYPTIFKTLLKGNFYDKLIADARADKNSYPRFNSVNKSMEIKNIAKNTDYIGGFALHGAKIIGNGSSKKKARLIFFKDDTTFLLVKANSFFIRIGRSIIAPKAFCTFFIKKDSIMHPGADFKINYETNIVTINRGEYGIAKTDYYNSLNEYEIDCESIEWTIGSDIIDFKLLAGSDQKPVSFESIDYYKDNRFLQFQGSMPYNPISRIKMYSEKIDSRYISSHEVAKAMNPNLEIEQIRRLLYKMVEEGFLFYDEKNEMVTVRDKIFKYVYAHAGNYNIKFADKIDYDVIRIVSKTQNNVNASLNVKNTDIAVKGVSFILLSDSQNVIIFPHRGSDVTLNEKRDFEFTGKIKAGFLELFGNGFNFNYDNFLLHLQQVDSFRIMVPTDEYDKKNNQIIRPVETLIENMTADLLIDYQQNKSGLRKQIFHQYPILKSLDYSFAYYDRRGKFRKKYPRKNFYFRLDTFELDSLNNLDPQGVAFEGTLFSAGIFPEFKDTLRIQEDFSLGFITTTPEEGLSAYGGKGKYLDTLDLSNQGFRGRGTIEYIASTTSSMDIYFFPDSMIATANYFNIDKGTVNGASFPQVKSDSVFIEWKPYKDSMYVTSLGNPFTLYDSMATMKGRIVVTPWGLFGIGKVEVENGILSSNSFKFNENDFTSNKMDLAIKSNDPKKLAFFAENVRGKMDMVAHKGVFESNDKQILNDFQLNEYKTSMDKMEWMFKDSTLAMSSTKPLEKTFFQSQHKFQDSLKYNAKNSFLSFKTNKLRVEGIPYIPIADAQVFPDSGLIRIKPKADIDSLKNASIKADTVDFFHQIYASNLKIRSKYRMGGLGNYDYINKTKTPQKIYFDNLRTEQDLDGYDPQDKVFETFASGKIEEEVKFELNPKLGFKGDVHLYAPEKFLTFEGYSKVYLNNPMIETQWFSFKDLINPDSLYISIKNPKNEDERPLHVGLHFMGAAAKDIYLTFLDTKINEEQHDIFKADGLLQLDEMSGQVSIGDSRKIQEGALGGNKLELSDDAGLIYAEGKFDLGLEFGMFKMTSAGNCFHDVAEDNFAFDLVTSMDFELPKEAMEIMFNDIRENTKEMPNINYQKPTFMNAMAEFLNEKKLLKLQKDLTQTGTLKIPDELAAKFFLTELMMKWDSTNYCYKTTAPIGIGLLGNNDVHKRVIAYMELGKKRSGDFMNLYIQAGEKYYYFNYKHSNRTMSVYSFNKRFNRVITDMPPKKRRFKGEGKGDLYILNIASKRKAESFLDRMLMEEDF